MESELRGRVEKEMDRLLRPKVINMVVKLTTNLPIKSTEDFCFGYIVGDIIVGTFEEARVRYGREPTPEEINEALDIITRRTMEIKGAIKFATSR